MANHLDHKKILKQVVDMRKAVNGSSTNEKESLQSDFNYLYTHVPSLFDMVYKNDVPYMEHLEVIMSNFSKVVSEDVDHKKATENVVNHLNKSYIDDKHKKIEEM